jgi:hypothetical protein
LATLQDKITALEVQKDQIQAKLDDSQTAKDTLQQDNNAIRAQTMPFAVKGAPSTRKTMPFAVKRVPLRGKTMAFTVKRVRSGGKMRRSSGKMMCSRVKHIPSNGR